MIINIKLSLNHPDQFKQSHYLLRMWAKCISKASNTATLQKSNSMDLSTAQIKDHWEFSIQC